MSENRRIENSPFIVPNIRLFVLFRILFNARLYYPVFTVLFLDFGLSLEQFALLNSVWAATIVLLEVPSGALADTIGRLNLLRFAAVMMLFEMLIMAFLPLGNSSIVFWGLILNRILSGTAEAAASGADEALAFDSLEAIGKAELWPKVLERLMRYQSIAFIFSLLLGSFLYDATSVNLFLHWLGVKIDLSAQTTMRFPLYLMLISASGVICVTFMMNENKKVTSVDSSQSIWSKNIKAFGKMFEAGAWILGSSAALLTICAGLLFDNVIRMMLTLNSQYYRVIELPAWSFGIIGASFALIGIMTPKLAKRMIESRSQQFNLSVLATLCFLGLLGMTFVWPISGLVPFGLLFCVMYLSSFMVSTYLNQVTSSSIRATVLSFKGLAFNLAYGLIGVGYGILANHSKNNISGYNPHLSHEKLNDMVFISTLQYFPGYFLICLLCFCLMTFFVIKKGRPLD